MIKIKLKPLVTICLLSVFLFHFVFGSPILAQGARLTMKGNNAVTLSDSLTVELEIESPTSITGLSINIVYDSDLLSVQSLESEYLYISESESVQDKVVLRLDENTLPAGTSDLGILRFDALAEGVTSIMIFSASAFAPDNLIVPVDSSQTFSVLIDDDVVEVPTIAPSPTPIVTESETEASSEVDVTTLDVTSSTAIDETSEETTESIEETTEIDPTTEESTSEINDSTTKEETSTMQTSEDDPDQTTGSSDDIENNETDNSLENPLKIWVPIVIVLSVALIILALVYLRKKNRE